MMKKIFYLAVSACLVFQSGSTLAQSTNVLTVKANQVKSPVQPTMWGIFFEDINMGADGGVYAELVKNRSFEFNLPLMGWREMRREGTSGTVLVINRSETNENNPRFIRVSVPSEQG